MATFRFKAYTHNGAVEQGTLEAPNEAEAVRNLSARGLLPFSAQEVGSSYIRFSMPRSRGRQNRYTAEDYASFTRELSALLVADLTVDQSLRIIAADGANPRLRTLGENLLAKINSGLSLSESLRLCAVGAPPILDGIVRAGEARGNIGATLQELAGHFEARIVLRSKIRSALLYPAILLLTALGAIGIVAAFLVPNLMPLFRNTGTSPPTILTLLESASNAFAVYWPFFFAAIVICGASMRAFLRQSKIRRRIDQLISHMPFFGTLVRDTSTSHFGRTVGTLLQSGVPLIGAIEIAAHALPNLAYASAFRNAAEKVKEGQRLSAAMHQSGHFAPVAVRFAAVGEETGKLARMLLRLSEVADAQVQKRVERATTLMGPLLTLIIGVLVGGLMVSVMQALLSVNDAILQ